MPGEFVTQWTVRLALVCYVFVLTRSFGGERVSHDTVARMAWTCGLLLFLAHVAAAFHFFHVWSHAAALEDTARRTEELLGIGWGGGLYFNYLFTIVWAADVAWWWIDDSGYRDRPRWVSIVVHVFMGFIAFNATVVFEIGPVRWCGIGATIALAILLIKKHGRLQRQP